jgi:HK97 family phage major capsid protein
LITELEGLLNTAKTEERAFNDTETARVAAIKAEIEGIDKTLKIEEEVRSMEKKTENKEYNTAEQAEIRAFANYIKSKSEVFVEKRSGEQNLTMANNGAVIPTTIVNRIINTVKEMCPIFAKATIFNVKGTLKVPVYGLSNTTHDITVGYQAEFTELTADVGQFTSVDLTGFLTGALSLIGKSVVNNSEIDVTNFVVNEMSRKIALFLEKELLNGTTSYATGALSTTNTINAGSTSAISADNLIDLQAKIPTIYQANACWTMNPKTFTTLKKLKDGNGQYLLQNNFSQDFPYAILGKPVYLSDNMPEIGSGKKAVLYGDYSGLGVNMRENIEMSVLLEKYSTMHAIGIVSWFEFDSDVIDNQKLATLTMSVG